MSYLPVFKNNRQKALEEFLNDHVNKLALGVYEWRGNYYEVLPYSVTQSRHNWSGFIKQAYREKVFMIREASDEILKKYYPKVWSKIHLDKAIKLNPKTIEHIEL